MLYSRSRRVPPTTEPQTRRDVLRRFGSVGLLASASAGVGELLGSPPARAATTQLPATMVLNALQADASPEIAQAIEAGCCLHYTRAEGQCGSGGCGNGSCCYHVTSTQCAIDETVCVKVSCAEGNFTTGC
jgi:hypothetical protein